jgi:hypothetical protein
MNHSSQAKTQAFQANFFACSNLVLNFKLVFIIPLFIHSMKITCPSHSKVLKANCFAQLLLGFVVIIRFFLVLIVQLVLP